MWLSELQKQIGDDCGHFFKKGKNVPKKNYLVVFTSIT